MNSIAHSITLVVTKPMAAPSCWRFTTEKRATAVPMPAMPVQRSRKSPPEDLAVVPGGEHSARVRQHLAIEEGGWDPGDERGEIQQARDERGSSQWSHDDVLVLR